MRMLRRAVGALLLLALVPLARGQKDEKKFDESTLPKVTYEQFGKMVRDLKGKVVVVYFWADY